MPDLMQVLLKAEKNPKPQGMTADPGIEQPDLSRTYPKASSGQWLALSLLWFSDQL